MKRTRFTTWVYQNREYESGMIFDFFACGPAKNPKDITGKKILLGAFPAGFMKRLKMSMAMYWPDDKNDVLHVCAGSIDKSEGLTLDIEDTFKPDILSNAEKFASKFLRKYKKVKVTIADPPYNEDTAKGYYRQKHKVNIIKMLREMAKVTQKKGFVILLDQTSPSIGAHIKGLKRIALIGVTSVPNQDCRLCTVWQKQ